MMQPQQHTAKRKLYLTQNEGERIWLYHDHEVGHGGEGVVYDFCPEGSYVKGNDIQFYPRKGQKTVREYVAKLYTCPTPALKEKIRMIVDKQYDIPNVCFPLRMLYEATDRGKRGAFVGYLMPKVKGLMLSESVFLPDNCVKQYHWTRIELCNVALALLDNFRRLHDAGIHMGDVNTYNILLYGYEKVYFIDVDSYQYDATYRCTVATEEFMSPRLFAIERAEDRQLRLPSDELYAIAVLLFMIFMPALHPYTRCGNKPLAYYIKDHDFIFPKNYNTSDNTPRGPWQNIWFNLHNNLRMAFYDAFSADVYPSIEQWSGYINEYLDAMSRGTLPKDIFPQVLRPKVKIARKKDNVTDMLVSDSMVDAKATDTSNVCMLVCSLTDIRFYDLHGTREVSVKKALNGSVKPYTISFPLFDYISDNGIFQLAQLNNAPELQQLAELYRVNINSVSPSYHHAVALFTPAVASIMGRRKLIKLLKKTCNATFGFVNEEGGGIAAIVLDAVRRSYSLPKGRLLVADCDELSFNLMYERWDKVNGQVIPICKKVKEYGNQILRNHFFSNCAPNTSLNYALKDCNQAIRSLMSEKLKVLSNILLNREVNPILAATGTLAQQLHLLYPQHEPVFKYEELQQYYETHCMDLSVNRQHVEDLQNNLRSYNAIPRAILSARFDLCLLLPSYLYCMEQLKIDTLYVVNIDFAQAAVAWYIKKEKQVSSFNIL